MTSHCTKIKPKFQRYERHQHDGSSHATYAAHWCCIMNVTQILRYNLRQRRELWFLEPAAVKVSVRALSGENKLKCFVNLNIFCSGVLGLWLGVCSPEQPLVPTGVKSPSSVSGRTEAVKRGLHSSIFTNQWKHFLSPCPPHALKSRSITAMCVIHSCVSWLLVNTQLDERFQVWCYWERSRLQASKPQCKRVPEFIFHALPKTWSWLWSSLRDKRTRV